MPHAVLREAKEEMGIDAEGIEISTGKDLSANSVSEWPSSLALRREFQLVPRPIVSLGDLGEGVLCLKLPQVKVADDFHLPLDRSTDPRHLREHQFCSTYACTSECTAMYR